MQFVFVVGVIVIMYRLTKNEYAKRKNRTEIQHLKNKVFELEQKLDMIFLYGKAGVKKEEIEKALKEEGSIDKQHTE